MNFKVQDYYFKKAKKEKFLARSVYKLEEIDKKYKIFKGTQTVIDLGYSPGAWCQYCLKNLKKSPLIMGIDIKDINHGLQGQNSNLRLLKKDIFDCTSLQDFGVEKRFDVLLSDMAPNTTGIKLVDQENSLLLVKKVFDMIDLLLVENGTFVIKLFDSHDAQEYIKTNKKIYKSYNLFKPKATRDISKEFYVIGKNSKK